MKQCSWAEWCSPFRRPSFAVCPPQKPAERAPAPPPSPSMREQLSFREPRTYPTRCSFNLHHFLLFRLAHVLHLFDFVIGEFLDFRSRAFLFIFGDFFVF